MNEVFEDLRKALYSIWSRRWIALAVAWGVCLAGWIIVALIPNGYESQARIYVQLDDVLAQEIGIGGNAEQDITRVRQTLASSVNLEKVVRSTRLGDDVSTQRDMDVAIEELGEAVTVTSEEDNLFELSALMARPDLSDAENAKLAQDVVQKLIDIFREENIAGGRGNVQESIVFLDRQLEERKAELEAAEQRRLAFEAANPELANGTVGLSTRVQTMRSEMRDVDADLAAAQSALAAISGQIAGTPSRISTPGQAGTASQALTQAQSQLAGMQARGLTDSHPDVATVRRQVDMLRRQAAREPAGGSSAPNPAYSSLVAIRAERQANVQALSARKAALQSDLSALMASQANEPAVAAEATRISRDYEVLKEKYDELLQSREEMRLRGKVESERSSFKFEVIDPPTLPRTPTTPNRPLLLVGVLFVGLATGIGTAFALGQFKTTYTTSQGLERSIGLPALGTISYNFTEATRALRRKRTRQFTAASAALGGLCVVLLAFEYFQRGMVA